MKEFLIVELAVILPYEDCELTERRFSREDTLRYLSYNYSRTINTTDVANWLDNCRVGDVYVGSDHDVIVIDFMTVCHGAVVYGLTKQYKEERW